MRFLLLLAFMVGCSPALRYPGPLGPVGQEDRASESGPLTPPWRQPSDGLGDEVTEAARLHLRRPTRGFRDDCSGFVEAVFARAGYPIAGSTKMMWERAERARATHRRRTPRPGDLAFFDNTWDRNGSGRLDDDLTHVAVVVEVQDDATIVMAHDGTSSGRSTLRMNLRRPRVHRDDEGRVLNDFLRARKAGDPPRTRYLAGELWRGFATVREEDRHVWLGTASS